MCIRDSGYTNARFVEFNDGKRSYDGNYVPYAPQHTLFGSVTYSLPILKNWTLDFNTNVRGVGRIQWNEENLSLIHIFRPVS